MSFQNRPFRTPTATAVLLLVLAPAVLLAPSLFGERDYMPFDPAMFPPKVLELTDAQRARLDDQPANTDVTEIPLLVVPELQLAQDEIAHGRFPGWNPYARFGAPLYANGLAAMAYPLDAALLLAGDPIGGLAFGAWLGFAIAGVLAFALLRRLGIGVPAATLGALAFALSGTMTANAHFYMRMNALVWLPGVLLACLTIADARGAGRALGIVGLGLCTAMTLLAGFPPFAVAVLLVAGLWSLPLLVRAARRDGARDALVLAGALLGGIGLGAAVAAVQVVPMFAFFPESNREVVPNVRIALSQAFDPVGLLGYVAPTALGEPGGAPPYPQSALACLLWTRPNLDNPQVPQFPHVYNYVEYTVFVGSLPLLLAVLGVIAAVRTQVRIAAVIAAVLFVAAVGSEWLTPFYGLPIVASVPPMRYMGPACVLIALLAAAGMQAALEGRARRRTIAVGVVGLVVAATCLTLGSISPLGDPDAVVARLAARYQVPPAVVLKVIPERSLLAASHRLDAAMLSAALGFALAGGWLLLLVRWRTRGGARRILIGVGVAGTVLELLLLAAPHNTGRDLVEGTHDTAIHRFLLERDRAERETGGILVARAGPPGPNGAPRDPDALPPGTLFPLRIRDLNAYAFLDQWSHRPFRELYGPMQMIRGYWPRTLPDDERLELPFYDLIGLRYVLSMHELEHAGTPVGPTITGPGGTFRIHERSTALPRAFVVHDRVELDDDDAVIEAMLAKDLSPRAAVLLTPDAVERLPERPPVIATDPRRVRFVHDTPDAITLEVGDGPAGDLVLRDAAISGWSATVDGEPAPVVRGNLFMRTIPIPAGATRVELTYRTPGLVAGIVITGSGLLACGWLLLIGLRGRGRSRRTAEPSDETGGSTAGVEA